MNMNHATLTTLGSVNQNTKIKSMLTLRFYLLDTTIWAFADYFQRIVQRVLTEQPKTIIKI
jgi:hypothetical protein